MSDCFIPLTGISLSEKPEAFTFPYSYSPHPWAIRASSIVQDWLRDSLDEASVLGKMFGVLVVENKASEIGFLVTSSGHIDHQFSFPFVQPIVTLLSKDSFFVRASERVNEIKVVIDELEGNADFVAQTAALKAFKVEAHQSVVAFEHQYKEAKRARSEKRKTLENLSPTEKEKVLASLSFESQKWRKRLKLFRQEWRDKVALKSAPVDAWKAEIEALKQQRKGISNEAQQKVFAKYKLLNSNKEEQTILDIFGDNPIPAGTGDCALPKLLQHAFKHDLKPIVMAEFWWGKPPKSEVRQQGIYYPACLGKCRPILGHMLEGMQLDPDPRLESILIGEFTILYEDNALWVVEKPSGLLSTPGRFLDDSVLRRLGEGASLVHRLDQDTSGLMVVAKSKDVVENLNKQFRKRQVYKKYIAVLEHDIANESGIVDLPIAHDYNNRPRQKICKETGKVASTKYKVLEKLEKGVRIAFEPVTGRTHQLRLHAAHPEGLHSPIVGDPFYGKEANRLHLHAAELGFKHPQTDKDLLFKSDVPF